MCNKRLIILLRVHHGSGGRRGTRARGIVEAASVVDLHVASRAHSPAAYSRGVPVRGSYSLCTGENGEEEGETGREEGGRNQRREEAGKEGTRIVVSASPSSYSSRPVLRDRLFFGVIGLGVLHGVALISGSYAHSDDDGAMR